MNLDEYYILFHENSLNLVAFKRVVECSVEILALVNAAIAAERKEWVGLTDEELRQCIGIGTEDSDWNVAVVQEWLRKVEAKLKEKNNG